MNNYFHFNDIQIMPTQFSLLESRQNIDVKHSNNYPLKNYMISAPMDTVFNKNNIHNLNSFVNCDIPIAIPRNFKIDNNYPLLNYNANASFIISVGLSDIDKFILNESDEFLKIYEHYTSKHTTILLVDVANGHMMSVIDKMPKIKDLYPNLLLMLGNIANPETVRTYYNNGVDLIRIGIGTGSSCTTSTLTGVGVPLAGLIYECRNVYEKIHNSTHQMYLVADGGISKHRDIAKTLNLGADYLMIGGAFNKAVESSGKKYQLIDGHKEPINLNKLSIDQIQTLIDTNSLIVDYRGMSTKEVQLDWGNNKIKPSEGKHLENYVEYFLKNYIDDCNHYLKTTMSYSNCNTLEEFIAKQNFVFVSNEYIKETLNKSI